MLIDFELMFVLFCFSSLLLCVEWKKKKPMTETRHLQIQRVKEAEKKERRNETKGTNLYTKKNQIPSVPRKTASDLYP